MKVCKKQAKVGTFTGKMYHDKNLFILPDSGPNFGYVFMTVLKKMCCKLQLWKSSTTETPFS